MNIFVYPPAHGFGMGTLFHAAQRALPARNVAWQLAASSGDTPPPRFQIAHLYSLPDAYVSFQNLLAARRADVRVVTTAIYWNPTRYVTQGLALAELGDAGAAAERAAQLRAATLAAEQALLRVIYRASDVLLALSPSEADALVTDFGVARERIVVAWCGVETRFAHAAPDLFQQKFGLSDFVLCVGRVDANKNQLSLIRALRHENLDLVLAGGSLAPDYMALCRAAANSRVHFLPSLSDDELASAFAAAKVHALVSWLEVVGLVTLEAAAAGANVVLTREHGARDYVGERGRYCDSADEDSIRRVLLDAYRAPRQTQLREHVLNAFTWEKHAAALQEAYARVHSLAPCSAALDADADLTQAVCALVTLVPALAQANAELWQHKAAAEKMLYAYRSGRVMRALEALQRMLVR